MGVRRDEVVSCDAEGNYLFEGLSQLAGGPHGSIELNRLAVEVYRIDDDGQISACSDLGQQIGDIKLLVNLKQSPPPLRSLVFDCREFTLVGLYDPRYLQALREVRAGRCPPQRRPAAIQLSHRQPDDGLLCGAGFSGVSGVPLRPDRQPPDPGQHGRSRRPSPTSPAPRMRCKKRPADSASINCTTSARCRWSAAAILPTSTPFAWIVIARPASPANWSTPCRQDSDRDLAAAKAAYHDNHGDPFVRSADRAWASQARVYQAAADMANDVIRGAIFLLLLCIPFSFCMERLLIGSPNIYRQLARDGGHLRPDDRRPCGAFIRPSKSVPAR